jgi:hypothetical protein
MHCSWNNFNQYILGIGQRTNNLFFYRINSILPTYGSINNRHFVIVRLGFVQCTFEIDFIMGRLRDISQLHTVIWRDKDKPLPSITWQCQTQPIWLLSINDLKLEVRVHRHKQVVPKLTNKAITITPHYKGSCH